MQITLNQQHLEAAVKAYVAHAGIKFPVEDVNFTAGRGKDGMTATINVQDPFTLDVPATTPRADEASDNVRTMEARSSAPQKAETKPAPKTDPKREPEVSEPVSNAEPAKQEAPAFSPEEDGAEEAPKAKASLFS